MAGPPRKKAVPGAQHPKHLQDILSAAPFPREQPTERAAETIDLYPSFSPTSSRAPSPALSLSSGDRLVEEIPRACVECARRVLTCDLASLSCARCVELDLPCISPLRPAETHETGFRRQIKEAKEKTDTKPTRAYGVMWYLARQFGEGKPGWEALRDFLYTEMYDDPEKNVETQSLGRYIEEMSVMDVQCLQEWKNAGEPGELDPALSELVYAEAMKAWKEESERWDRGAPCQEVEEVEDAEWPQTGFIEVHEDSEIDQIG
ncbi:hypothetical protein K505DRAFT_341292 [Melanomma pulvis-pyrius CBS 109.77]|uniref:Zn(2)-C6 fungal-type domain-containing protein n=1 Tax=Melanomma pulvis-pyrius CBS 109.77 TaxID=1314802 RepID=A0A6A6WZ90_9PLEO|nr:hypothetical protein K505DRAFT_341292 [Melanomma pulvis-pyrius CBS 109.77]